MHSLINTSPRARNIVGIVADAAVDDSSSVCIAMRGGVDPYDLSAGTAACGEHRQVDAVRSSRRTAFFSFLGNLVVVWSDAAVGLDVVVRRFKRV